MKGGRKGRRREGRRKRRRREGGREGGRAKITVAILPTFHLACCPPQINAMANRAVGKGYEAAGYYPNTSYQFYNIQNIHVMRESLQKMLEGGMKTSKT